MRLGFVGTRGNTAVRTRRHRMHSALVVSASCARQRRVMVDCGADWLGRLEKLAPDAIVITHAHPDHAGGLRGGAPCPVFATEDGWVGMADCPIEARRAMPIRKPLEIEGITFEAFPVEHSVRAPAVGYRISAGGVAIFYVPDVVAIRDRAGALAGTALFVGDGATMTRPMVRRRGDVLFGHTPIRTQLGWCQQEGVTRAIFTHCGSEILEGDERRLGAALRAMARARGVAARIAHDGLQVTLPDGW